MPYDMILKKGTSYGWRFSKLPKWIPPQPPLFYTNSRALCEQDWEQKSAETQDLRLQTKVC